MEATAGGARKHLRYLTLGLRERGHALDLLVSTREADPDFPRDLKLFRESGCQVEVVDMAKRLTWGDWPALAAMRGKLRDWKPDIVHTHCAKAGLLGRLATIALSPAAKVVHTPHSFFFQGMDRPLIRRAGILLERGLGRRTDLLCCISEAERAVAESEDLLPTNRILVAPNGLPEGFAASLLPRVEVRDRLGLPDQVIAIAFFARLVPRKGHLWFLEGLAAMPDEQRRRVRLCMFGKGPVLKPVKQRIEALGLNKNALYYGYEPNAERLLSGMDVAVLPSFYEGLSYQLLEALAAGLPMVASDVPGNRLEPAGNPVQYVAPRDSESLAGMLTELVDDDERRRQLGEVGSEWVARHFRLGEQLDAIEAGYRRLSEEA